MVNRNRHYRIAGISYPMSEQILNLPDGFTVDAVENDNFHNTTRLRIRCPELPEYEIEYGCIVPYINAVIHTNEFGVIDRLFWPDLGDTPPDDNITILPSKEECITFMGGWENIEDARAKGDDLYSWLFNRRVSSGIKMKG